MDFYEVVGQAAKLLQQQGRLTYRTLRRQFDLDDEALEDLKEELLYSHPVRDDEGRGLVWTGETEGAPEPASQPDQTTPQPPTQQDQPSQVEPPPPEPPTPDAERRQLTVMFSDLVESTKLSGQLDPEDYREVLRAYQATCSEVIHRYDGYISQHLGDALLVYFGFPQAHEDDAQRAIHTGLGMLEAMKTLNNRLEQDKGIRLAIRVGIHTGLTVISDVGSGQKHEMLALGEAPNISSRIQALAQPDSIAISADTCRLVEGYFTLEDLGLHTLKGVAEPQQVYRVIGESEARSRLDIASARGLTPLVGRESEVTLLQERWNQVKDGQGQVVLLSGEGGIGKSRLVQVLKEHVADEPHTRWECRSSPYYQNTALYPITDFFQRTLQWQPEDSSEEKLEKLERTLSQYRVPVEEAVQLFAPLLSLPISEDRYPPLQWSPQRQRQKTLESIVAILLEQAEQQPVLFIMEDLHWLDPTSLELLDLLMDQIPTASILTLLTCRPAFQPTWRSHSYLTQITLNRLSRNQIERIAEQVAGGKSLPIEVLQQIVEKTDGVPLFVEEMTKAVLESGHLKEIDGHYELTGDIRTLAIPATLQDSLMARLDRLVSAKGIAQLGATIGRQFSYALLQAVSQLDDATLQRELSRLVEAELLYYRGLLPQATYTFKHALITDIAYQSLLKSTRQQYHQRIATVLEAQFPETAETQPELPAQHYTEASLTEKAMAYWQRAGENAIQRSANVEAISHFDKGLELLKTLPDTAERTEQELILLTALGPALMATRGYASPEVGATYARARALCQSVQDTPQLFPVLVGLRAFYFNRGELQTAYELAEQLFALTQRQHDSVHLLEAHRALGTTLRMLGKFSRARAHLEQGIALHDDRQRRSPASLSGGADPVVICLSCAAQVLWFLGYPDQSLARSHEACTLARRLSHTFSLIRALGYAASLHQLRREGQAVRELREALQALYSEQGSGFDKVAGSILEGWALTMEGFTEDGIAQLNQGLAAYQATVHEYYQSYFPALLAEAYGKAGQLGEGLTVLTEGLNLIEKNDEHFYEAELHRLQGELLLQLSSDNATEAETSFQKALEVARSQEAKSLELRAATSLSRLWQRQGKRDEARQLLSEIYGWFTEGFDTKDLQEARALLDELAESR